MTPVAMTHAPEHSHPFIPASTLKLSDKLLLPRRVFVSCLLHPIITDEDAVYAYISRIYREGSFGFLDVSKDSGGVVCTVKFDLAEAVARSSTFIQGFAANDSGVYCGSVAVTKGFIPLFYGDYRPLSDALIFLPSACRFIRLSQTEVMNKLRGTSPKLTYMGTPINLIRADGVTAYTDEFGGIHAAGGDMEDSGSTSKELPSIKRLEINGQEISDPSQLVMCGVGGLSVETSGDTITIGRLADL